MGKTVSPGILERDEAHQHVAVLALAADLLGVHARGLVAVVTIGDQQLEPREYTLHLLDRRRVATAPEPVQGAVGVGHLAPGPAARRWSERRDGRAGGIGVQREDRREVRARRARQAQAVLPRGPGWVRSCGRIRPRPYSSTRTRAKKPRRVRGWPSGP